MKKTSAAEAIEQRIQQLIHNSKGMPPEALFRLFSMLQQNPSCDLEQEIDNIKRNAPSNGARKPE